MIRNDQFKPGDVINVDGCWEHAQKSTEKEPVHYEDETFYSKTIEDITKEILLNPSLGNLMVYPDEDYTIADFNSGTKFKEDLIYQTKCTILENGDIIYVHDIVYYFGTQYYGEIDGFITMNDTLMVMIDQNNYPIQNVKLKEGQGIYRAKANGNIYLTLCYSHFIDDYGRSKKSTYNPVTGHYYQCLNVPAEKRSSSSGTKVLSNTLRVDLEKIWGFIAEQYTALRNGFFFFSAFHQRTVFVDVFPYMLPADNYMASWYCNHMGAMANKFCRFCNADDATRHRKNATRNYYQIHNRMHVKKGDKETTTGCKPTNPHLIEYLNPIKDTPIDILHTLYLGTAKHYMKDFISSLTEQAKRSFSNFINENTTLKGKNN